MIDSSVDASNILSYSRRQPQAFTTLTVEPRNHAQAMTSNENASWRAAEAKEINNMITHQVWIERPRQPGLHSIPSTWAYKKKLRVNNEVTEYKARICAQGFRQTYGLNFELKYAPTGKPSSLRLLLSFAVSNNLLIHQLDVKSAFLTCNLEETVYMLPPPGYKTGENIVLELKKAIYGLKQASLAWYNRLRTFLTSIGFSTSIADPCVFWKTSGIPTWIFAHVDDLVIISKDPESFKKQMESEFQIKYLGEATFLLGMKLDRMPDGLILNQSQYIERKLVEFNASDLPPSSCPLDPKTHLKKATQLEIEQFSSLQINYRAIVGSLNYLSILTRPDISYAVSKLSQFLENPGISHYKAAMQVFRYLNGT
ncbi:hypothetical protein MJO29_004548 [Puccinia striiformis f. sp. tritici]|nr:hypothetical protein MJO29_004548 [Puccinia striiformis f. sp. tritici]